MRPFFPESGTPWAFQFTKDGFWKYGGCFIGFESPFSLKLSDFRVTAGTMGKFILWEFSI